jgi:CubicO group peptidase (beta-lactamase class C family)
VLGVKVRSTGISGTRGSGRQYMFVLPDRHLVIVHLHARGTRDQDVGQLLERIMLAAPGWYRPLPK